MTRDDKKITQLPPGKKREWREMTGEQRNQAIQDYKRFLDAGHAKNEVVVHLGLNHVTIEKAAFPAKTPKREKGKQSEGRDVFEILKETIRNETIEEIIEYLKKLKS